MICLAVLTDGRDALLERTLDSIDRMVGPSALIEQRLMFDDTGDMAHQAQLALTYPAFDVIGNGRRNGFGGAVREFRAEIRARSISPFVLWCEDDFEVRKAVDLSEICGLLTLRRPLVQMALTRQPWSNDEKAVGTILSPPEDFEQHATADGVRWVEHRRWWTTNLSVFRRELLDVDWPEGGQSEGRFTHRLLADGFADVPGQRVRFGYWGRVGDSPWTEHVGHQRAGIGY